MVSGMQPVSHAPLPNNTCYVLTFIDICHCSTVSLRHKWAACFRGLYKLTSFYRSQQDLFINIPVARPKLHWLKWHHWRWFIRFHRARSGETKKEKKIKSRFYLLVVFVDWLLFSFGCHCCFNSTAFNSTALFFTSHVNAPSSVMWWC